MKDKLMKNSDISEALKEVKSDPWKKTKDGTIENVQNLQMKENERWNHRKRAKIEEINDL